MDTYHQFPHGDQHPPRRERGGTRWYLGGAAALLAIGAAGGVVLAGHSSWPAGQPVPAAATGQAGSAHSAAAGPAAVLSALLSSAGSQAGTTTQAGNTQAGAAQATAAGAAGAAHPAARRCVLATRRLRASGRHHAARVVRRHCRRVARRRIGFRLLGGMYGQFTFRAVSGTRTIAFERGTVVSRDGSSVVVRAADGTGETWQLVSDTVVRRAGARTSRSALADGEPVFVAGPVVSGAHEIRLAVIRPAAAATGPAGAAGGS